MNKKLEKLKERDEIDRLGYSQLDSSKRLPACPTLVRHSEKQKPIKVTTKTVRTLTLIVYKKPIIMYRLFTQIWRRAPMLKYKKAP